MAVLCSRYAQGIFPRIVNHKRHIQHKNNVDLASSTFKSLTSTNTCIILSCYQSTDVLRSSGSLFLPNSFKHQFKSNTSRLLNTFCSAISNFTSVRPFSLSCKNASKDPNYPYTSKNEELMLMEFPQTIWPSVIYTIKNWILATLIIRPYMDRDFSLDEFSRGAKKAVSLVASLLKQGQIDEIKSLVTPTAFEEIQKNYPKFYSKRPNLFEVAESDMYFSFPYRVGIMLNDNADGVQKRLVEILMCFHYLLGSEEIRKLNPTLIELQTYRDKVVICNCRFIKEFTKGSESDWTINVINFFQPHPNP